MFTDDIQNFEESITSEKGLIIFTFSIFYYS